MKYYSNEIKEIISLIKKYEINLTSSILNPTNISSEKVIEIKNMLFNKLKEIDIELYNRYMKKAGAYSKAASTTMSVGQLASTAFGVGAVFAAAPVAATSVGASAAGISESSVGPLTATQMAAFNAAYTPAYSTALTTGLKLAVNVPQAVATNVNRYNQI